MKEFPASVYRLQLGKDLSFKQATKLLPYLNDLGVDGVYTSPIFAAAQSGYDISDPNKVNPILGTLKDFDAFCLRLQNFKMHYLLDVVPNHMGMKDNPWWLDVLEKGPDSSFADFFDIRWTSNEKILLPLLNDAYGNVLKKNAIQLIWEEGFWIRYLDYKLPINYASYYQILLGLSEIAKENKRDWLECLTVAKSGKKEQFVTLYRRSRFIQTSVSQLMAVFNHQPALLHPLLEVQFYRLAFWKVAGQEINYRRFFNINHLVAIHIENVKVLNAHHQWVFELLKENKVQGLRIDHPDGLYNPNEYFERIRQKKPAFVWAEKILDSGETLPPWPVEGTVGYDFLNVLGGIFIQQNNERKLTQLYSQFIENELVLKEIHYERRKHYLISQMASELNVLGAILKETAEKNWIYRDFTQADLKRACLEIMACLPVYRTYIQPGIELRKKDKQYILYAVEMAKNKAEEVDPSVFEYIKRLLLMDYSQEEETLAIDFVLRLQQLTPTVMAKGMEDSAFYIYNRLISLNEVGGNPEQFGFSKDHFHSFCTQKLKHWPLGALASSTHDTKLNEDARYRLHALSELADVWALRVTKWKKNNQRYKTCIQGVYFPDLNTEYYLYQMLLALWPAAETRIWECLQKAVREAGLFTSWRRIDEKYEAAVKHFLESILSPRAAFLSSFKAFHKTVDFYGKLNALSALVLKIGAPGIVDIYQGNECFHYCLMDPDNRRPIDYQSSLPDLKTFITKKALTYRREQKDLFIFGDYIPLKSPEQTIAFARKKEQKEVIVLARRFFSQKVQDGQVVLPKKVHAQEFVDLFTGKTIRAHKKILKLDEVFKEYPFALLKSY